MDKNGVLLVFKAVAVIGLIVSAAVTLHYEINVKQYYSQHPQQLDKDTEKIKSYVKGNGCVSKREVWENTGYGYFQSWYLLSYMTKNGSLVKYPEQGICLTASIT